jgi:hypothetical protein
MHYLSRLRTADAANVDLNRVNIDWEEDWDGVRYAVVETTVSPGAKYVKDAPEKMGPKVYFRTTDDGVSLCHETGAEYVSWKGREHGGIDDIALPLDLEEPALQ